MSRLSTIVAGGLVGILLLTVTGIIVLAGLDKPSPSVLDNLASGALGALAALLARVGTEPQAVQVVNDGPGEAVPVDAGRALLGTLGVILLVLAAVLAVTTLLGLLVVSYGALIGVALLGVVLLLLDGSTAA